MLYFKYRMKNYEREGMNGKEKGGEIMALTKEDLQALSQLMDVKLDPIKADVSGLKKDMVEVKSDVSGLKKDMVEVKSDVSGLKKDMVEMKSDVSGLKKDMVEVKSDVSGLKKNMVEVKSDVSGLKKDILEVKDIVSRNYDKTLEFYGKQQEYNTAQQEQMEEMQSLFAIYSRQTIRNTTELRQIK